MEQRQHHVQVIGAGSIGNRHIRCLLATGRARVSVVEVNADLRVAIARQYAGVAIHESLEIALADGRPDAAVIATPAPLHVAQATRLASRGIHLLIEKPLGVSLEGVDELQAAVRRSGVVAAVGYVYRAHPVLNELREALASGAYGRPVELVAVCGQHFPHYRPAFRQTYFARHDTGGGAVQDALTHIVNAGEWLVGEIERVVADTAQQVLEGVEVEDTAHVLARHAGGLPASYNLNQHQAPDEITITVVCDRGTLRFEYHANRWRSMTSPGGEWTNYVGGTADSDTMFVRQAHAFLNAVEGRAAPLCTLDEGAATLRVNLAILASARGGCWQSTTCAGAP
ncbi:MAG TPA: Gfo/Idh/MocA family oxidoreductase [Tepidisphaeraceae bacterium]|nr:Gfo/Idh/MocA family oxidoreductase [Tepidisphaeraceae bacterium]